MSIGNIGENYIYNELLRRGITHAYLANSSNQDGWDIVVFEESDKDNNLFNINKIQVKTLNWKNDKSKVLTGNFTDSSDFDYLAMVIINYSEKEPYINYMIPKGKLEKNNGKYRLFNDKLETIQYTNSTITLAKLDEYKDKLQKVSEDTWIQIEK